MSWATDRRLDYVAWRASTVGEIRRGDIMRVFGISMVKASQDLQAFQQAHPEALAYDKARRCYRLAQSDGIRQPAPGIDWATLDTLHTAEGVQP